VGGPRQKPKLGEFLGVIDNEDPIPFIWTKTAKQIITRSDVDGWPSNRLSIARYLNVTALGGWHRVTEIGQEFRSSLATRGQIGSDYVQP